MCSTPALLKKEKQLHLAVKYSDHPPALWVHTKVNTHILCIAALSFLHGVFLKLDHVTLKT